MEEQTTGVLEFVKNWPTLLYAAFVVGCSWTAIFLGLKSQKVKTKELEDAQIKDSERISEFDLKIAELNVAIVNIQKEYIESKKDIAKLYVEFEKYKSEIKSIILTEDNSLRFITYPAHDIMQNKCHEFLGEVFKRHEENIKRVEDSKLRDKDEYMNALKTVSGKVDILISTVGELKGALHK